MSVRLQVIGVVDGKVRLLTLGGKDGPVPFDLARIEALELIGKVEAAAQQIPGPEFGESDAVFMRVEPSPET